MIEIKKQDFLDIVNKYGGDLSYLSFHYERMSHTLKEYESTKQDNSKKLVLDIGAHWCHQALLWRLHGYDVIAADLKNPIDYEQVKHLCRENGIQRIVYVSLENPVELNSIDESSVDIVLFTEIIEHLTFNPVNFWKQIYRMLKPNGNIIITTPNFYYLCRRPLSALKRFFSGYGAGISVNDLLERHTTNPHWKEYSLKEIIRYFEILSPDFLVYKALYITDYYERDLNLHWSERIFLFLQRYLPVLKQNVHIEVKLVRKSRGITVTPEWK